MNEDNHHIDRHISIVYKKGTSWEEGEIEDDTYHKIMNWGFLCARTAHLLGVNTQCPIVKHFSGRLFW